MHVGVVVVTGVAGVVVTVGVAGDLGVAGPLGVAGCSVVVSSVVGVVETILDFFSLRKSVSNCTAWALASRRPATMFPLMFPTVSSDVVVGSIVVVGAVASVVGFSSVVMVFSNSGKSFSYAPSTIN